MDCFQRLEALVDSAGVDDIEEATALLRRFKGRSREVAAAIDEFMLDFMTLVFVVETAKQVSKSRSASLLAPGFQSLSGW
ncbi:hypothetical protein [Mesorhizobium sp.]|uniref:hypothetical protein n=1 Tax=Mesorhizobium sp. TaxID=1871066 RepID=UPI0025C4D356|nr:hypothetical protein [Mesorhizobium sp.]